MLDSLLLIALDEQFVTSAIAFVAVVATVLTAALAFGTNRDEAEAPIRRLPPVRRDASDTLGRFDWEGQESPDAASMAHLLVPKKEKERKQLGDELIHAGLYRRNSVAFYVGIKAALLVTPILLGFAAASAGMVSLGDGLFAGGLAGVLGTIAPSFWLAHRKRTRQTLIRRALPDALDIIVICVEAGLSLPAAILRVSKELQTAHPLLAAEMRIVQRETQMGVTTGDALRQFADRFDLEELRTLGSTVQQSERFGASIVQALRVHAESLRIRRQQRAEELAQKAAVKLLLPTIMFIFPALFVVVLGPAVYQMVDVFLEVTAQQRGSL